MRHLSLLHLLRHGLKLAAGEHTVQVRHALAWPGCWTAGQIWKLAVEGIVQLCLSVHSMLTGNFLLPGYFYPHHIWKPVSGLMVRQIDL